MLCVCVVRREKRLLHVITQKPHSSADLHIGSPLVAIESEILCFDYNLWSTSAPLIALYPADHNACNERVTGHLSPRFPHAIPTKTRCKFFSEFVCKLVLLAWFSCMMLQFRFPLGPCVMKSCCDVSICIGRGLLYMEVLLPPLPFWFEYWGLAWNFSHSIYYRRLIYLVRGWNSPPKVRFNY